MARFKIIENVPVKDITFLEVNARYMGSDEFNQLVANIKRDGELSSVPFCIKEKEGKYKVISGNHRVKAAIEAGLVSIHIMAVDRDQITKDEEKAIQISHNSISGKDDLKILREILYEIDDAGLREYAFIDESIFDEIDGLEYEIIQPTNEVVHLTFTFFDHNKVSFEKLCDELDNMTLAQRENLSLLPLKDMERFNKLTSAIQKKYGLKSHGFAILQMVKMVEEQLSGVELK